MPLTWCNWLIKNKKQFESFSSDSFIKKCIRYFYIFVSNKFFKEHFFLALIFLKKNLFRRKCNKFAFWRIMNVSTILTGLLNFYKFLYLLTITFFISILIIIVKKYFFVYFFFRLTFLSRHEIHLSNFILNLVSAIENNIWKTYVHF